MVSPSMASGLLATVKMNDGNSKVVVAALKCPETYIRICIFPISIMYEVPGQLCDLS